MLTYVEFAEKIMKMPIVLVPLGSFEQHGPSGYLGADYVVANHIAKKISKMMDIISLPCLPFGFSEIHSNFPGTVSFGFDLYESVVTTIINDLRRHGVKKIVFINGHGGNAMPLKEVIEMEDICWIEWFALTKNIFFENEHKSHAGSEELSLLAHIDSDYVSQNLVQDMIPSKLGIDWRSMPPIDRKTEYLSENGVFFYANKWSPDIGKEIEEFVVDRIMEIINKFILDI
nr:creatininase family protein [uncultured Acetatifactor sp.]